MKKEFQDIIKEICKEENIKYTLLSKNWIIMLEKNDQTKFISGYKFDLNNHGLGNVIDDKYALYEVLKAKGIPVAEYNILFNKENNNDYAKSSNNYNLIHEYFINHNNNIVIKSNTGTCGKEVFNVRSINDISDCLNKLFKNNFSISVSPFYNIKTEYRIIVLKGKCILLYAKRKPIVIGKNKKTIKELLQEFNYNYFKDKLNDNKYNCILEDGKTFEYNWQFNLSRWSNTRVC